MFSYPFFPAPSQSGYYGGFKKPQFTESCYTGLTSWVLGSLLWLVYLKNPFTVNSLLTCSSDIEIFLGFTDDKSTALMGREVIFTHSTYIIR